MEPPREAAKSLPECPKCHVPAGTPCVTGPAHSLAHREPHNERRT
jgi:hypothetical protein